MSRKLYKTREGAMISGVLKGFSEYFGIDVSILRVGYVVAALFTTGFPFLLLYIVLSVVMPDKNTIGYEDYEID